MDDRIVISIVEKNARERREGKDVKAIHCDADMWTGVAEFMNPLFYLIGRICESQCSLYICYYIFRKPYIPKEQRETSMKKTSLLEAQPTCMLEAMDETEDDIFNKSPSQNRFTPRGYSIHDPTFTSMSFQPKDATATEDQVFMLKNRYNDQFKLGKQQTHHRFTVAGGEGRESDHGTQGSGRASLKDGTIQHRNYM